MPVSSMLMTPRNASSEVVNEEGVVATLQQRNVQVGIPFDR